MIRIREVALSPQPYRLISSNVTATLYGSTTFGSLASGKFLVSQNDLIMSTIAERKIGSLTPIGEPVGRMRDKGVRHLNASADLEHRALSICSRLDGNGINQFQKATLAWVTVSGGFLNWGCEKSFSTTIPSYTYTSSGVLRSVDVTSCTWTWMFLGDRAILVGEIIPGTVRLASNGQILVPSVRKSGIRTFRRDGSSIYSMGDFIQNGEPYTSDQTVGILASIASSGGTLVPTEAIYRTESSQLTSDMVDDLIAATFHKMVTVPFFQTEVEPDLLGDLALECAEQLDFVDQNVLSLVFDIEDLTNFRELFRNVVNQKGWQNAVNAFKRIVAGRGKVRHLKSILKPFSSMYLFEKYVVLPNVSDIKRLLAAVEKSSLYLRKQRIHSRRVSPLDVPGFVEGSRTTVLTVQCAEYPTGVTGWTQKAIGSLKRWGVYPEVTNLWDMIPYSFCFDWIVNVGDFLEGVNSHMDTAWYFPISYCVISQKDVWSTSVSSYAPEFPVSGNVEFSFYTRWVSRQLPLPAVHLPKVSASGWKNHLVESSALAIQRL